MTPDQAPELFIADERMLQLMNYCIERKVKGMATKNDWLTAVGFKVNNLNSITTGRAGFTKHQYKAAADLFEVDLNWLFGLSDQMLRVNQDRNPWAALDEAVAQLQAQFGVSNTKKAKSAQAKPLKPATGKVSSVSETSNTDSNEIVQKQPKTRTTKK